MVSAEDRQQGSHAKAYSSSQYTPVASDPDCVSPNNDYHTRMLLLLWNLLLGRDWLRLAVNVSRVCSVPGTLSLVQAKELIGTDDSVEALNLWVNFPPWGGRNFKLMIAIM